MSEYKNGGNNNMLWEQGAQVRILLFLLFPTYLKYLHGFWAQSEKHLHLIVLSCDFCQCNALIALGVEYML